MSDEDIDKAVKEAAEFEAQDKNVRKLSKFVTKLTLWYSRHRRLLMKQVISLMLTIRQNVEADLNALKSLVESTDAENMTDAQVDEIKAAKEKLMTSAQNLFAKMYEANQAAGGAAGAGPDMGAGAGSDAGAQGGSTPYGDDVVDGDYKEV